MSQVKTLILIRHAHRTMEMPSKDNGISDKGQLQVKKLVKFAQHRLVGSSPLWLSSPKKRCIETISPILKEMNLNVSAGKPVGKTLVEIDPRLIEHGPTENAALFSARMDEFLDFWKYEGPEVTVICSHGDWIPFAIYRLTGVRTMLKKSGWAEIEYANGECTLTWLVQKHY